MEVRILPSALDNNLKSKIKARKFKKAMTNYNAITHLEGKLWALPNWPEIPKHTDHNAVDRENREAFNAARELSFKGKVKFKPETYRITRNILSLNGIDYAMPLPKEGEVYPLHTGYLIKLTVDCAKTTCLGECGMGNGCDHLTKYALLLPIIIEETNEKPILHPNWDTALTNAIVVTNGRIQPYTEILQYLKSNFAISFLLPIEKEEPKPFQLPIPIVPLHLRHKIHPDISANPSHGYTEGADTYRLERPIPECGYIGTEMASKPSIPARKLAMQELIDFLNLWKTYNDFDEELKQETITRANSLLPLERQNIEDAWFEGRELVKPMTEQEQDKPLSLDEAKEEVAKRYGRKSFYTLICLTLDPSLVIEKVNEAAELYKSSYQQHLIKALEKEIAEQPDSDNLHPLSRERVAGRKEAYLKAIELIKQ